MVNDAAVKRNGGYFPVRVSVRPVHAPKAAEGLLLISFEDAAPPPQPTAQSMAASEMERGEESTLRHMENELKATREDLQSTIEELESSNEELKVSNEEIMSMNEELQSANEELETSKEELQSLNEELSTVNSQLQEKVEELEKTNNDIANLLNCTDVATIFLDSAFRIQRFTPAATKLFNLIASDVGRPLEHITPKFVDPELLSDAQDVLERLVSSEKEVRTGSDGWWIRRIMPYRTRDNRIEGVVVTFTDASGLKQANEILEQQVAERTQSLRDREKRLESILNGAVDAIITMNRCGIIQTVNPAAERMFGYSAAEMVGQNVKMLMPPAYQDEHDRYLADYVKTRIKKIIGIGREVEARRKDGSILPVDLAVSEIEPLQLFTGILRDISRRKQLEREVVEIASLQQQRIGQDLHDSVGQELAALGMLANDLADTLRTNHVNGANLVDRIALGLQRAQDALRGVLRGMYPVPIDSKGLVSALGDLAVNTELDSNVTCRFECPEPEIIVDGLNATHFYLIAQEAVHNAVKHGRPHMVHVTLEKREEDLVLRVADDGIGMPTSSTEKQGLGMRIMRNRAAILGAVLTVEPCTPSGTLVKCVLPARSYGEE